jgi:hypothetical protein
MLPKTLYKYREDGEFTKKIIVDRQIWLPLAKDLNDPFECQTGIIPEEWKRKVILEQENAQLLGAVYEMGRGPVETLFSMDRRQTKGWLKALAKAPHKKKMERLRKLYRDHGLTISNPAKMFEVLEQQLACVGIFSLSSDDGNDLMWAHYAKNHTGLALGFTVEDGAALAEADSLIAVTYSDQKPVFSEGFHHEVRIIAENAGGLRSEARFPLTDPVFRATISTKPISWSYEAEWRYVQEKSGVHPSPARLGTVTFGLRMPPERRAFYTDLLRDNGHDVQLREVRQTVPGKFEVLAVSSDRAGSG